MPPIHSDQTVLLVLMGNIMAILAVYDYPPAARDIAYDLVTGHGMAALGAVGK